MSMKGLTLIVCACDDDWEGVSVRVRRTILYVNFGDKRGGRGGGKLYLGGGGGGRCHCVWDEGGGERVYIRVRGMILCV